MSEPSNPQEHTLILMPSGRRGQIKAGTTLLEAAQSLGVEIESICGGRQTCVKCLVKVEEGEFDKHGIHSAPGHVTPITENEIQLLEESGHPDLRLACIACIQGDLLVSVPEESRAQKQMIRKSATDRVIEVKPTVRQVYIEVERAELGKHRGDWGRVQDALKEQWDLKDLSIDLHALRKLQKALRVGKWTLTVTVWDNSRVINVQPGYSEGAYGLAVDVGSTTIASYLCDLRTGELLATEAMMNPQVSYGEDLMSRISYAA
ncbi:MAG: 2Fe-2S iron-sulfur cluster-binding protein, partial [Anaerolineales bacterium]